MFPSCPSSETSRDWELTTTRCFDASQIVAEVAAIRANIAELKETIAGTKDKQKQAKDDVKRLEKEMNDFKNNKDSKLAELKVRFFPSSSSRFGLR